MRLYIDDDFVAALRVRDVDVRTASDDAVRGHSGLDQLRWSTRQGRVLYSFNVADFYALHTDFLQRGGQHAGIILAQQQRHTIGDQWRGVLALVSTCSGEDMVNQTISLSAWIERS